MEQHLVEAARPILVPTRSRRARDWFHCFAFTLCKQSSATIFRPAPVLISHKWSPVWVNRICSDPRFHGGLRNRAMQNLGVRSLSKVKFLQNWDFFAKSMIDFQQMLLELEVSCDWFENHSYQKLKHLKKKEEGEYRNKPNSSRRGASLRFAACGNVERWASEGGGDSLSLRGKIPLGVYIRFCFKN